MGQSSVPRCIALHCFLNGCLIEDSYVFMKDYTYNTIFPCCQVKFPSCVQFLKLYQGRTYIPWSADHGMCALRGDARAVRPGLLRCCTPSKESLPCARWRELSPTAQRLSSEKRISFTFFCSKSTQMRNKNVPKIVVFKFSACYNIDMKQFVPVSFGGSYA